MMLVELCKRLSSTAGKKNETRSPLSSRENIETLSRTSTQRFIPHLANFLGLALISPQFLVSKLIRLCPAHRASILQEFQSNILRLLLHREASPVLADAFELYANAYERTLLLRDFYGREVLLFGVTQGSAEEKERAKKGLSGVLEGVNEERRKRTLAAVKENLLLVYVRSRFLPDFHKLTTCQIQQSGQRCCYSCCRPPRPLGISFRCQCD